MSDTCCHYCDDTVYKVDTEIETVELQDTCQTLETVVCKLGPSGRVAQIQYDYQYKNCCNDGRGEFMKNSINNIIFKKTGNLHNIGSTDLVSRTCSEKTCTYDPNHSSHSVWSSTKVENKLHMFYCATACKDT